MTENTPKPKPRSRTKASKPAEKPAEKPAAVEAAPVAPVEPLRASALVMHNEYARNSTSVRRVQAELSRRGHWQVQADPTGYWGDHTQAAAAAETGKTDPVEAARALGFEVQAG